MLKIDFAKNTTIENYFFASKNKHFSGNINFFFEETFNFEIANSFLSEKHFKMTNKIYAAATIRP